MDYVSRDMILEKNAIGNLKPFSFNETFAKIKSKKVINIESKQLRGCTIMHTKKLILVTDHLDDCLKLLDFNGNLVRSFKHKRLKRPSYVCVDKKDRIYIYQNLTGTIAVFEKNLVFFGEMIVG